MVIATRNDHKVEEIRAILSGGFQLLSLNDFPDAPKVVEDADTFAGNAEKKAGELAEWLSLKHPPTPRASPLFVLADDSGLEVDELDGAPGVHSARFAAADSGKSGNASDADNNAKLLRLLANVPVEKRTARFHCVLALVEVTSRSAFRAPHLFDGSCEGRIRSTPRGKKGFGYDPLFVPVGLDKTFAELGKNAKNRLSHRAQALAKLKLFFASK